MTSFAKFWAVDLHVHTPGSSDAKADNYGTAADIVNAALEAGLDTIAVTDHNTAVWCDDVAQAAQGTNLIVLPGVEISTTEGHLLAIWEEGTSSETIRDLLVALGIKSADHGRLEIAAKSNLVHSAKKVAEYGGVAIAAHVDRPRGLLGIEVKDHLRSTLMEPSISAVEIFKRETQAQEIDARVAGDRILACVQGSDTWDVDRSCHALSGIGHRRTWIKASRPDLVGLKHALADPDLRLRLDKPSPGIEYPVIESVGFQGGFMDGQTLQLAPDLNCLLGGTGAGKSLVLEAIRYALCQQVDPARFPSIADEVHQRLRAALGETGVVILQLHVSGETYRIERVYGRDGKSPASVMQLAASEWAGVTVNPRDLVEIAAFSQGEILEYAREPVGRMSLVDAGLDLLSVQQELAEVEIALESNGAKLITARDRIAELRMSASQTDEVDEQLRKLSAFFDTAIVQAQGGWTAEKTALDQAYHKIGQLVTPEVLLPKPSLAHVVDSNWDLFERARLTIESLERDTAAGVMMIDSARSRAVAELEQVTESWRQRFVGFKGSLDQELDKVNPGESLAALRARLEELQTRSVETLAAKRDLESDAEPALVQLNADREALLGRLANARTTRRALRRARVGELNRKMAGQVKLDVPNEGDFVEFRQQLELIKVGSQVRSSVLDAIARYVHPLRFGRLLWAGDISGLVDAEHGIDSTSTAKLLSNIDDRNLWAELLEVQMVDRPDLLTVSFKKPGYDTYTSIEQLAHGQKCTAILIILLADGTTPALVDQPEDALHAPWIEEYLVERLRALRGNRQYIFPTRSPGLVVSADAEQIITLSATAGSSTIEASGSLERHDLNRLALHHLEGGPVPFARRTRKLSAST